MWGDVPVLAAIVGGTLIGGAAGLLLLVDGRIAGVSGILAGLWPWRGSESAWRAGFVGGLLCGGLLLGRLWPPSIGPSPSALPQIAFAGLLVGFGARLGNGCTSGHGVCGLARRSSRSLVATVVFISTGALSVFVVRHLLAGGRP